MLAESNELRPEELAWIESAMQRYITRREEFESDVPNLTSFANEIALLTRLLTNRIVHVEDRVGLMLALRHERKILLTSWTRVSESAYESYLSEVDLINRFLKRLSQVNWESMGIPDMPYDSGEYWGSFRITEAEAAAAFYMTRSIATYTEPFELLSAGSIVTLAVEDEDGEPTSRIVSIRIARACLCTARWDEGEPNGVLFEGDVISEPSDKDSSDEVFGILFPGGHAVFVDSSPDSDYTDRHIRAALVMLEAEREQ